MRASAATKKSHLAGAPPNTCYCHPHYHQPRESLKAAAPATAMGKNAKKRAAVRRANDAFVHSLDRPDSPETQTSSPAVASSSTQTTAASSPAVTPSFSAILQSALQAQLPRIVSHVSLTFKNFPHVSRTNTCSSSLGIRRGQVHLRR